ncbi:hypothetical protein [Opitutus terrae]|uniref:Uncharacterized protein n=1 Tax=Opitutus terrae (strain DSM 11246 / JCM 15787 / PB90-1) TaxID=452637 RepID=B1ZXN1_OPITP|nr:hypothetical protein [Opitutus terrae]ACB74253.1 hypothetical protein Oter_0965 [Opitutus terrae PB90-1]
MQPTPPSATVLPAIVVELIRGARFFALRYETFVTPAGDLADITREEVRTFAGAGVVLAPWHERARGAADALQTGQVVALDGSWELPLGPGFTRKLSLLLCREPQRAPVIFLRVSGCFLGWPTAYATPELPADAIVYAQALDFVLRAAGARPEQWAAMIDWECSPALLALHGRHRTLLHLQHIADAWLGEAVASFHFPAGAGLQRGTALQAALRVADVVTGASRGFCDALRREPVYRDLLAAHLQSELTRIVPLENAHFGALGADDCALADELASDRHHAGMVLAANIAARRIAYLGNERQRFRGAPLILCGGRNTTQHGWDIAIACARRLLETNPNFTAAFWFVMLDGDDGASRRLAEIADLERDFPRAIVRSDGSKAELNRLLAVADLNLCPSLFEPFGRCYSRTIIPLSSATDGPGSQIPARRPRGRAAEYHRRWHGDRTPAGWTVFPEVAQAHESTVNDWKELISGHPVAATNATFRALVDGYCAALLEAIDLRSQHPIEFAAMVCSALRIQREHSWAQSYQSMIDLMESGCVALA